MFTSTEIRQATPTDANALMFLVHTCIQGMLAQGIDQWDEVYPKRELIEDDLQEGGAFVAMIDEVIVGMGVINEQPEPEYAQVPWRLSGRSAIIHRVMVAPRAEGRGVALALMRVLESRARALGCDCIRLDAFAGNARAIRFYERAGYLRVGQVSFRKGSFACFEKSARNFE